MLQGSTKNLPPQVIPRESFNFKIKPKFTYRAIGVADLEFVYSRGKAFDLIILSLNEKNNRVWKLRKHRQVAFFFSGQESLYTSFVSELRLDFQIKKSPCKVKNFQDFFGAG